MLNGMSAMAKPMSLYLFTIQTSFGTNFSSSQVASNCAVISFMTTMVFTLLVAIHQNKKFKQKEKDQEGEENFTPFTHLD